MPISFAVQSYKSDSLPVSAQRTVNAYAEFQPQDAKAQVVVFGSPGVSTFATVGEGPIRALFEMNGVGYAVSRDKFYSFNSAGVPTFRGAGITGQGVVSVDGNGTQIVIVNGTNQGWVYNSSTTAFVQITDTDFQSTSTATFLNQYFAFDWLGTNKFFLSDLLDGTAYSALMFASAESKPDRVIAGWNQNGVLLVFGEKSIEFWDNTGASSFPFQRIKGATLDRGLAAPLAVTSEDTAVFFLGNDRVFYRMDGRALRRLSTHAIEKEWETYDTITDAFCFSIPFGGHKWIGITFPTEGKTWITDIAANYLWHERISWDQTGAEVKWRCNAALSAFGHQLIGDANSGKIGKLDASVFTEFGDPIITKMVSPPIHGDGKLVFMPLFELDMQVGVGLTSGQGSDPQVMLDWSDDGGETFVGLQLWRSMGQIGNYQTRLQWDGLGSFYQRVMRLHISDPVKRVVIAARAPRLYVGE